MNALSTIRQRMIATAGMLLLTAGLATPLAAQSAATVSVSAGMSVQPPAGWRAQGGEPNKIAFVGPDGSTTIIAVLDTATEQAVTQQLTQPVSLGNGVVLTPRRQPFVAGDFLVNEFTVAGTTAPALGLVTIKRFTDGRALALVGIAPQTSIEALRTAQYALMQSIRVSAMTPQTASANGWGTYLRGRYLARFYSGNGYHERQQIWLCSDGTYALKADGGGATAGLASGAFRGGHSGRWTAAGALNGPGALTLTATNGQQLRFTLQMGQDGVYANGKRWMRGNNTMCR